MIYYLKNHLSNTFINNVAACQKVSCEIFLKYPNPDILIISAPFYVYLLLFNFTSQNICVYVVRDYLARCRHLIIFQELGTEPLVFMLHGIYFLFVHGKHMPSIKGS